MAVVAATFLVGGEASPSARAKRALQAFDRRHAGQLGGGEHAAGAATGVGARLQAEAVARENCALFTPEVRAAAAADDVAMLDTLEEWGAELMQRDSEGVSALSAAIARRRVGALERLLRAPGATPSARELREAALATPAVWQAVATAAPRHRVDALLRTLEPQLLADLVRAGPQSHPWVEALLAPATPHLAASLLHRVPGGSERWSAAHLIEALRVPTLLPLLHRYPAASAGDGGV